MEQPLGGSPHGYLVGERLHLERLPWHRLPGAAGELPPKFWHPAPHHTDRGLGGNGGVPISRLGSCPLRPPPRAPPLPVPELEENLFIHHPEALVQAAGDPDEDPAASRPPEETLVPGGGSFLGRESSFLGRVPPTSPKIHAPSCRCRAPCSSSAGTRGGSAVAPARRMSGGAL